MITLFENHHVICIDKPWGFLSVDSRFKASDPRPCVARDLEQALDLRLYPVHRLDFEVSGLILFAKTPPAQKLLSTLFENKQVIKTYEAITEPPTSVNSDAELLFSSLMRKGKKRAYESPFGKESLTKARYFLKKSEISGLRKPWAYWSLNPITGRSHQLRFHLSQNGAPIVGDALYGSKIILTTPHLIALRAVKIVFNDPATCEKIGLPISISTVQSLASVFESQGLLK